MRPYVILLILGLALAAVAIVVRTGVFSRKNPGRPINSAMRHALGADQQAFTADEQAIIAKKYPGAQKTASGLLYVEHAPGEGATPAAGTRITAHYDGTFLDGKKFDSSRERGEPFSFHVGTGRVIKGWDEAFLGMKKGGKRTLIVPWWLGYGERGRGPIPPYATLVFEVELLAIE